MTDQQPADAYKEDPITDADMRDWRDLFRPEKPATSPEVILKAACAGVAAAQETAKAYVFKTRCEEEIAALLLDLDPDKDRTWATLAKELQDLPGKANVLIAPEVRNQRTEICEAALKALNHEMAASQSVSEGRGV